MSGMPSPSRRTGTPAMPPYASGRCAGKPGRRSSARCPGATECTSSVYVTAGRPGRAARRPTRWSDCAATWTPATPKQPVAVWSGWSSRARRPGDRPGRCEPPQPGRFARIQPTGPGTHQHPDRRPAGCAFRNRGFDPLSGSFQDPHDVTEGLLGRKRDHQVDFVDVLPQQSGHKLHDPLTGPRHTRRRSKLVARTSSSLRSFRPSLNVIPPVAPRPDGPRAGR